MCGRDSWLQKPGRHGSVNQSLPSWNRDGPDLGTKRFPTGGIEVKELIAARIAVLIFGSSQSMSPCLSPALNAANQASGESSSCESLLRSLGNSPMAVRTFSLS